MTSRDMLRWAVGRLTENVRVAKLRSDAPKAALAASRPEWATPSGMGAGDKGVGAAG